MSCFAFPLIVVAGTGPASGNIRDVASATGGPFGSVPATGRPAPESTRLSGEAATRAENTDGRIGTGR